MATDFTRYQAPGVYTESVPGPQVSVYSNAPEAIGIFGATVGYRHDIESLTIDPDLQTDDGLKPAPTVPLRQKGVREATVVVSNPSSGTIYSQGTDYTIEALEGGSNTRSRSYVLKRVIDGGHIQEGDRVQVEYDYTDDELFKPTVFYDYDDVVEYYGSPFDGQGGIQSELTLAARLAFLNGASHIIGVAVDSANPESPVQIEYEEALNKLVGEPNVSIIVPATGMQSILPAVLSHVTTQSQRGYERRAILGIDGTKTKVSSQAMMDLAQSLRSKRISLVSTPSLQYNIPELDQTTELGGQFAAAALAGLSVSNSPALPLTRKLVLGFAGVTNRVADGQMNQETQAGLMVIETMRSGALRVRHGVTTNPSNIFTREWTVTGQEDAMVYRIRSYLDADGLIGSIINDLTLVNVKASAESSLRSLVQDGIIRNYRDLKVRQIIDTPDVIEVRFEWQASLPLNYISVRYSISTTTGEIEQLS